MYQDSLFDLVAGSALAKGTLVKYSSATAVVAGAADRVIGVVEEDVDATQYAAAARVTIRDIKAPGLHRILAGGTIAAGAEVEQIAAGLVDTYSAGTKVGRALTGGATGELIIVKVYSTVG